MQSVARPFAEAPISFVGWGQEDLFVPRKMLPQCSSSNSRNSISYFFPTRFHEPFASTIQSCEDMYTFNSALSMCVPCQSQSNLLPIVIVAILGVVCIAVVVLRVVGFEIPACVASRPPMQILKHVDRGMLKVIWSTYQITSTVSW